MLRNHLEKRQRHGLENVLALVQCSQRRNAAEPLLGQKESWLLCPSSIALCFAPSPVKEFHVQLTKARLAGEEPC